MNEEIGRIKKSNKKEIVVRVDEFKDVKGVTIREFIHGTKYEGFTKNGTRIPLDKWQDFKNLVNKIP